MDVSKLKLNYLEFAFIVEKPTWWARELIDAARSDGSLPAGPPSLVLARVIYQMWLGAALLAKLSQDKSSLVQARAATVHLLTCEAAPTVSPPPLR